MRAFAEVISKNADEILERWMLALKSKITLPKDLLGSAELRKRSAEFLRSLQVAVHKGDLANVEAHVWEPLRSLLKDIFPAPATQGVSPSDGAFYVFSLKDTLTEFLQEDSGDRPASFKRRRDLLAHLLDQLGLYVFAAIAQSRAEGPADSRPRPTQAAGDTLDTALLLQTLAALKQGDFSVHMPSDQTGLAGEIADTLNDIIELEERTAHEFERVSTAVGREGDSKQRVSLGSLRERAAEVFASLQEEYGLLLDRYLKALGGEEPPPRREINALAERLGEQGAGPRDLVDLHIGVVTDKCAGAHLAWVQAYTANGRLLALEVMGYLVDYYRLQRPLLV